MGSGGGIFGPDECGERSDKPGTGAQDHDQARWIPLRLVLHHGGLDRHGVRRPLRHGSVLRASAQFRAFRLFPYHSARPRPAATVPEHRTEDARPQAVAQAGRDRSPRHHHRYQAVQVAGPQAGLVRKPDSKKPGTHRRPRPTIVVRIPPRPTYVPPTYIPPTYRPPTVVTYPKAPVPRGPVIAGAPPRPKSAPSGPTVLPAVASGRYRPREVLIALPGEATTAFIERAVADLRHRAA
jgi:hypothetical protein